MAQSAAHPAERAGLIAQALAQVPGLVPEQALPAVEPLQGGRLNHTLLVRTPAGAYVLRTRPAHAVRGSEDLSQEVLLQTLAAKAALAPALVWSSRSAAAFVSHYAAGRVWTQADMQTPVQLERLGAWLRTLHSQPVPSMLPRFDAAATAARYRRAAHPRDAGDAAELDRALEEIVTLELLLAAEGRDAAIIHGDLTHENVIDDGKRLVLVDWEYASVADPLYDLGCLLAYEPAARAHAERLARAAGLEGGMSETSLARATRLYELMSMLWWRAVEPHAVRQP